jgi:hypothetical protein
VYNQLRYRYPVSKLWSGGSYGNRACFARTDRASNLDGFWIAATNEWVCGRLDLRIEIGGVPVEAASTSFYPGHQQTSYLERGLTVEKTVFVPYSAAPGRDGAKGQSTFYTVLRLESSAPLRVRVTCDVRWPAVQSRGHTKQPERHHTQRRVRQWLDGAVLWAQSAPFRVERWDTTLGDANEVRALLLPEKVEVAFSEPGRARLTYNLDLGPGEQRTLPFVLAVGTEGPDALQRSVSALPGWEVALAETISAYGSILNTAVLHTPDERINRGMQWAKANTVRVQHDYRLGAAFTNDPPQDIVVVRDCAWYGLGADWLTADFVEEMYNLVLRYGIHEGGKLTEYIHADTGQREDYALNINDDTPLFVVAAHHHYAVSGNAAFLERAYPAVRQACEWILAQRREGLVWCSTEGADVWGNATWRNIIPGYNLAGAVTEINALCYWALLAAAEIAEVLSASGDAERWQKAAAELHAALNTKLAAPEGLYVLNMSEAGTNATRTADLVFPLLGAVADRGWVGGILDLMYGREFFTPYGIHTVGNREDEYHPNFGHGLMGGLWPNLTAWVAFAGRSIYPERVAEMMSSVYALSEPEDPAAMGHIVPGEFPEWFDGETFESRGMAMSPWMPPTYLWLGVEGLAGVTPTAGQPAIAPNLPESWRWLSMRNLPFRGGRLSFFWHQGTLHTTHPSSGPLPQVLYARDVTDEVVVDPDEGTAPIALESDEGVTILLAATREFDGVVRLRGRRRSIRLSSGEAVLIEWNKEAAEGMEQP